MECLVETSLKFPDFDDVSKTLTNTIYRSFPNEHVPAFFLKHCDEMATSEQPWEGIFSTDVFKGNKGMNLKRF